MGRMLTTREVGDILNVPPESVRRWIRQGVLSGAVRVGSRDYRVPADVLAAFVEARRVACARVEPKASTESEPEPTP